MPWYLGDEPKKWDLEEKSTLVRDYTVMAQNTTPRGFLNMPTPENYDFNDSTKRNYLNVIKGKDPVKDFLMYYIQTPGYKERLKRSGYGTDLEDLQEIVERRVSKVAEQKVIDKPTGFGAYYDSSKNTINIDRKDMRATGQMERVPQYLPHEYSHALKDQTGIEDEYKIINPLNYFWRGKHDKLREGEEYPKMQDILRYSSHGWNPEEAKADIDQLRFDLWRHFKKDPGQRYNIQDVENAKKLPQTISIERIFKRFKDEDLLKLLNTIAMNSEKPKSTMDYYSNQNMSKWKV